VEPDRAAGRSGASGTAGTNGAGRAPGPGAAGPQGPIGPAGPSGGGNRAVGSVAGSPLNANPIPAPTFYPNGKYGWASVERIGVGSYCLTPDPSIAVSGAALVLSLGSPGATFPGVVMWSGYCNNNTGFQVQTENLSGNLSDYIYFTAVIP
jgi:hypothetical protein